MAQAAAREAITQPGPAVDADMPTLHVRCGSDIKGELEAARFAVTSSPCGTRSPSARDGRT